MLLVFAAAILLVAAYKGGRWLETRNAQPEARGDRLQRYAYEDTIEVDGTSYRRRKNVTSILLMGIDRANDTVVTGYRNGGQADFCSWWSLIRMSRRSPGCKLTATP